ncbi:MAG: acyl--CoA ligase [Alphaproteobacteria bacterium]|nr:acyl--CoA ligase [Alphaproteobacteria bacterium]MBL6937044.1 acyl--CoA ligase [Alphaproteobacteria bacterium]MBL7096394.1 acyl--CoA ligase [Alphaproteobacteria bacterium]
MALPAGWPAISLAKAHEILTAPGSRFETAMETIRGIPTKVWKNAPPTNREVFMAGRQYGDREFLIYEDDRCTFETFARATLKLAAQLQADGVKKGDRVAIIMRNLPEWVVCFYAAEIIGAILTPLNAWWTGPELEYGLVDSGTKIAFVDSERMERIAEHLVNCPALEKIYVSRYSDEMPTPIVHPLEDVIGKVNDWGKLPAGTMPNVAIATDDDATILYTSGTTGRPKGALGTHRNMMSNIIAAGFSAARNFLRKGEAIPVVANPLDAPQRATLLSVPFFHATGCFAVLGPTVVSGGKIVLMRKFDAEKAMALIEKEKINGAGGVPTIAWQILEHPNRHKYDLSSLESMAYGGAPSAPELVRQIKDVWPKSAPGNGWGMTETSATCTTHSGEDYENRPSSCGPAVGACEIKIMDIEGKKELPRGEVGELWARGPNIVKGYWNKPEATASTFKDGWVITGDLARIDEEGFCFIIDRAKDMLIRGGENIYCIEVENVLYDHPAVMDAALVAVPHKTLGEEPGAVVHLKPGMHTTELELREFVAGRLAAFKVPVKVVFWPETLPRNANGKILKTELKKIFAEPQ